MPKTPKTTFTIFRNRLQELISCDFLTDEERITKIAELAFNDDYDEDED